MLKPKFRMVKIEARLDKWESDRRRQIFETLSAVGETFANAARTTQTYEDQTTNLRSSIGYAVVEGKTIKKKDIQGKAADGKSKAIELASALAVTEGKEDQMTLIGFAAMEYASPVEAHGFDVITGAVPGARALLKTLKAGLDL